jgi:very-short-patch-repair endonuclease
MPPTPSALFADRNYVATLITVEHFEKGRSIRAIERSLGVGKTALSSWCKRHGIAVRSRYDQVKITNNGAEFKASRPRGESHWTFGLRCDPRFASVVERMRTTNPSCIPGVGERIAATRARTWREKLTPQEQHLFDLLSPFGAVAQHNVGRFTVDVAFITERVAVEVDGKNHWSRARKARDTARDAWLVAAGWRVLRVSSR